MLSVPYKSLYCNSYLTFMGYCKALTNHRSFMKTLIMLPIYTAIIILIMMCIAGSAHAWPIERVGVEGAIQDTERAQWVKDHTSREYAGLSIRINGKCVDDCLRPIDGAENAIRISSSRTSRPDEYMDMPTSKEKMERYAGR